ncbi:IclR family transcriptional regulator [Paraferrimonas sp. SM1919]|uniref:IclR family transcriptional regulator n=1 Tax=Paraferrimonas sp. SM1919 TaxID=2662263 RepID=UPI0013D4D870|nr:IclR family transcriptional regulator [Paraferrimonas sp. SM1919]
MSDYIIPNLSNACSILIALSEQEEGMSAIEIAHQFNLPRTTVFRILKTLEHQQMIEKKGKYYNCGSTMIRMGIHLVNSNRLREKSLPILQHLAKTTGHTAHVAVPNGDSALIVEVVDSPRALRASSRPGTLAYLHSSGTGKIFLAHIYYNERHEILGRAGMKALTANTITKMDVLDKELASIEEKGYAVDELEYHEDIRCLAAPVRDARGVVVAAIGITAPAVSFQKSQIEMVAAIVKESAIALSKATYLSN